MSLASSLIALVGVAARRPAGLKGGTASIPAIEKRQRFVVDAGWLRAYRHVVGAVDDGLLPPCAPQVLASPLHTQILGDKRFPLPALGMVHVENRIDELAPIAVRGGLALDVTARVAGHVLHDRGVTFDIVTTVELDGATVWTSTMTALVRAQAAGVPKQEPTAKQDKPRPTAIGSVLSSSTVRVPADQGRRYARVSGDANPIHLSALSAKPFGFPRAIAHGMWTLARALSEVHDALPPVAASPRRIDCRFVRPVLLPSTIVVDARVIDGARGVALHVMPERKDRKGAPHLVGSIVPLPSA